MRSARSAGARLKSTLVKSATTAVKIEDGGVERDAGDARDVGRVPPRHQPHAGERQAEADDRARRRSSTRLSVSS